MKFNLLKIIILFGLLSVNLTLGLEKNHDCPGCIESRVNALLDQMTPDEKIGQLVQFSGQSSEIDSCIEIGLAGSILNVIGAEEVNKAQKIAVEKARLGIPLIFGLDVIHGFRTIYPIPLAESATWEPALLERCASMAAKEASAAGINWTFAPMVDIARDARWGRIAEGAGEDPYLGCRMAAAKVRGFQGTKLSDPETIVACPKHFAAYGAAIAGKDYNTVDMSVQLLRDVYLPPFKAALDAGARTMMCAFNEINGMPCSGNEFLLTTVLRKEWGFDGFVVSDWQSILEMLNHGNVANKDEVAFLALKAGVDLDMMGHIYRDQLPHLYRAGKIDERWLDRSVARILRIKFEVGLFENPYANPDRQKTDMLTDEHLKLALEAARKSIVLLKNANNILPLKKDIRHIAVIGPLADSKIEPLGSWHCVGQAEDCTSVLEGIKHKLSSNTMISFAKGCEISGDSKKGFDKAISNAKQADVAILVVGEDQHMSGEAGSRVYLGLPGVQRELLQAVYATGTPIVVVLMNGRPLALPWIAEHIPAIIEIWQPGVQCGQATADVLFGDFNPSGKLTVSFPRAVGQEPLYYNHKNTGRPPTDFRFTAKYYDVAVTPQFPFGFGLSYTTYEYSNLTLSSQTIGVYGTLTVTATVKNGGQMAGDEVVQLYIRDLVGSLTRPVKELKGFRKIHLKPGEEKTVSFELGHAELGFHNQYAQYVVEPGTFEVWVGASSVDGIKAHFDVVD